MLYGTMLVFRKHYPAPEEWVLLTESLTGYGLGGSVIAMFGRVGGGIYTKAADVGADLVGKVVHGLERTTPRTPLRSPITWATTSATSRAWVPTSLALWRSRRVPRSSSPRRLLIC